jgi:hypothetical protein
MHMTRTSRSPSRRNTRTARHNKPHSFFPRLDRLEHREVPAAFTPNDIVVLRVGDGATYTTTAPIFLDEYAPNKAAHTSALSLVQSFNISTTAQSNQPGNQVITSDLTNGTGVEQLNRSFDSSLLTFGGIQADTNNASPTVLNRVIATVGIDPGAAGGIDTRTYGQMYAGDDLRAVAYFDSSHIYTVGKQSTGPGGTRYFGGLDVSPTTGTQISHDINTRGVTIGFDGRMYWSAAGNSGIFSVPTDPLPTTTQATDTRLVVNPFGQSEKIDGIFIADMNGDGIVDNGDRMYYTGPISGLWVSTYNGTTRTWGTAINLANAPLQNNVTGVFGITGSVVQDPVTMQYNVQLFVTTYDKNNAGFISRVYGYYDVDGINPDPAGFTDLLDLPTTGNQGYRGVSYAPLNPTTISLMTSNPNPQPTDNVTFTATISSANGSPTGNATFIAYNPADILDTYGIDHGTVLGTAPIDGTGHASISLVMPNAGPSIVKAYYSGTGSIAAATSSPVSVVVTGPNTSSTDITSISPNPATKGQTVTLQASVTGSAGTTSGTVTFKEGATVLGISTISAGNATLGLNSFSVGTHTVTAYYSGDANYKISFSPSMSFDVHAGATSVVTSSIEPSIPNQLVTFTATVTGNGIEPAPVGNVTFFSDGVAIAGSPVTLDGTGHATIGISNLTGGSHFISAQFNGDTHYAVTNSVKIIQTVTKAFTPGNLIVERIGDGVVPLSSGGTQVFLDEYTPAGAIVQSIALPIADSGSTHILTLSGAANTEGGLTMSGDGHYLTLAGFDAPLGTPGLTSTSPATVARTVARIDAGANLDTSTAVTIPTGDALENVRGAVSQNGKGFWIAGDSGSATASGLQYAPIGLVGTPTPIGPGNDTARIAQINRGQLFASTTDTAGPIVQVGTGLPTVGGPETGLPGLTGSTDPFAFLMFDHTGGSGAPDLMYIADQTGGLLKYYFDGTNWVQVGVKYDFAGGFTGLTGYLNASNQPVLFATGNKTAKKATASNLVTFTDSNPYNANFALGNVTELANVTSLGEGLRGVAFVPSVAPETVASVVVNNGAVQRSRVTTVQVNFDPSLTLSLPANPADAFQLKRQSDNALVTLSAVVSGPSVTLTFTGGAVDGAAGNYSLADGRYTLTVFANQVNGGSFDGNGDGVTGDDYALVGAPGTAPNLFRFFGDINGDGTVSASDFIVFRQYFGGVNDAFDFNGDGAVAASDFAQFRQRFGGSI